MAILSTELTPGAFKKKKKQKHVKHSSSSHMGDIEPTSDGLEKSAMLKNNQTQALMSNAMVSQQFVSGHTSVPMNPAQTIMDSNGQQFFVVLVNSMPQMFQPGTNVPNANTKFLGRTWWWTIGSEQWTNEMKKRWSFPQKLH